MIITDLVMRLNGYKKVALTDTKKVLKKKNNFKWVKQTQKSKYTLLPTGTFIEEGFSIRGKGFTKVIKPDSRIIIAQYNLPYGINNTPIAGSYIIAEYERCQNIGSNIRPNYLPSGFKKVYASKSPEEVIAENNAKKAEAVKEQRKQNRLKFIEEFNKKYDRKDIKGTDGSRSKYVIDKETGDIISFWRKSANGIISGQTLPYGPLGKETSFILPNGDHNIRQTVYGINGGRHITGIVVPCKEGVLGIKEYARKTAPDGKVSKDITPTEENLTQLKYMITQQI